MHWVCNYLIWGYVLFNSGLWLVPTHPTQAVFTIPSSSIAKYYHYLFYIAITPLRSWLGDVFLPDFFSNALMCITFNQAPGADRR